MLGLQQAIALNESAKMHEKLGNTLLASWMRESAIHVTEVEIHVSRILDEMPLGNYEQVHTRVSRRVEYTREWYEYEEEYLCNWGI